MFNNLKSFFSEISNSSDEIPEEKLHLAAAVLMIEVAKADQQVDQVELDKMAKDLAGVWTLNRKDVQDLIQTAISQSDNHASLHEYVSLINEHLDQAQKIRLIQGLWEVACADDQIHHHEEHLIRRLADLMYVSHKDFIRGKHHALRKE